MNTSSIMDKLPQKFPYFKWMAPIWWTTLIADCIELGCKWEIIQHDWSGLSLGFFWKFLLELNIFGWMNLALYHWIQSLDLVIL